VDRLLEALKEIVTDGGQRAGACGWQWDGGTG